MRRYLTLLVIAVGAAIAGAAPAPGEIEALRDAVGERLNALGIPANKSEKKVVKGLDKARRALYAKQADDSLVDEIRAAAKAAKLIGRKAPDEAALLGLATDAADAYATRLGDDLSALRAIVDAGVLRGKKGRSASKSARRAQKALDRAAASENAAASLKQLTTAGAALAFLDALDLGSGADYAWIIDSLTLAPSGTGLDLDGDGQPDNGLGGAQSTLAFFGVDFGIDAPLAASLADGSLMFVIQMWGVGSFDADPLAFAGTLSPEDGDADPSDNFSGVEVFTVQPEAVDSRGHALVRSAISLDRGVYEVAIDRNLAIPLGETPVVVDGIVRVRATASAGSSDGLLGLVIPAATVRGFVEASQGASSPLVELALGILLDLDTDGDGTNDAMSVAFEFTSVPCVLEVGAAR